MKAPILIALLACAMVACAGAQTAPPRSAQSAAKDPREPAASAPSAQSAASPPQEPAKNPNLEITGSQTVEKYNHTFVRSVPTLFQLGLPLTGWKVTSPAPDTAELFVAQKPGLRASVKWLKAGTMPEGASERAWLELWKGLEGLLVLPAAEPETETIIVSPKGHAVLDRRLRMRAPGDVAKVTPNVGWQLVTARPYKDGCLFFILLANWGTLPIEQADLDRFLAIADLFNLRLPRPAPPREGESR